jgi:hypothetical protein
MGYKKPELNSGSEEWRAQLEKIEAEYPLVQHTDAGVSFQRCAG